MVILKQVADRRPPSISELQDRFALTHAEAHLASALLVGSALSGYAAQRRISVATVRCHLRAIFRKTATHSQAEFVAMAWTQKP